jgi:RNA polymerase sigma-70 factor (ECF subfamily)
VNTADRWPAGEGTERTDKELVVAAQGGDESSFDLLFYRYRDGIYRVALAVTKDPSAAEEILVDTFARAYRALARLDPQNSLRPWLYRVALNLSYNRRPRGRITFHPLEEAGERAAESLEASPQGLAESKELQRVVLEAIDRLSFKHRVVVILHHLQGLDLAEIAEIVDCPVGTVKSRLHYALRHLRVSLLADRRLDLELPRARPATEEAAE